MEIAFILVLAFILDWLFGDPQGFPHPICLIGNFISWGEKFCRKRIHNEFVGGMVLSLCVITVSFCLPFGILWVAYTIHRYLGIALQILFCYQILAAHSLKKESMRVYTPLEQNNLPLARKMLSWIVGRDTEALDADGVTRAAVETVAENTTDGVIAPLLFMAIGGAPLGFLYKAINTLDSMIGYKNEKYFYFGKFAARVDDVANYIPARLSAGLMIAASWIGRFDVQNAIRMYKRDRRNHKSPNSAQTESVCAGALNIQLAGNAYYFGKLYEKPTIGDANRPIQPEDIKRVNRLMYITALLGLGVACAFRLILGVVIWNL